MYEFFGSSRAARTKKFIPGLSNTENTLTILSSILQLLEFGLISAAAVLLRGGSLGFRSRQRRRSRRCRERKQI